MFEHFYFCVSAHFGKAKWLFTLKNQNQDGMVKWVVLSGCLSDWRKWFPKPFPRQHDPKQKWVRGRSRRVWETRSRVFRGVGEGSKRHHSHYRNGDDRQCQIVPPSVILSGLITKTSMRIETTLMKPNRQKFKIHIYWRLQSIMVKYRSGEWSRRVITHWVKPDTQLRWVSSSKTVSSDL